LDRRYRDKATECFANGDFVEAFEPFKRQAFKRLNILENATSLEDLKNLPSNRFEKLLGDRRGQYSININMQWRICFEWSEQEANAFNIEIVDYH
jgi:proteic killer suppression protein